jgi:hypothetical protein
MTVSDIDLILADKEKAYVQQLETWIECNFIKVRTGMIYNPDDKNTILYVPKRFSFIKEKTYIKSEVNPMRVILEVSVQIGMRLQYLRNMLLMYASGVEIPYKEIEEELELK